MSEESDRVYYVYGFTQTARAPESATSPLVEAEVPPHLIATAGVWAEGGPASGAWSPPVSAPLDREGVPGTMLGEGVADQHPPFLWRCGEVAVVLSLVSRAEFCGPAAEKNLQDLVWLARRACRHQAALEQVMRWGPVWPTRLGTLFSSLQSLGKFLAEHGAAIARFLERVGGQEEWAVKGFLDEGRAAEGLLAGRRSREERPPGSSPGRAYLQEQGLRLKVKQELEVWLAAVCHGLLTDLSPLASEVRERRILSREAAGGEQEMVLNWAFLLPRAAAAGFRTRIARANGEGNPHGLAFELSGPWPPYSFCPALEPAPAPGTV